MYFQITSLMRANAELKEMLEQKDAMLDEKDRKIGSLQEQVNKRKKPTLNKVCSKEIRHATKKLKKDHVEIFDFSVSASHANNAQMMERIVDGAMRSVHATKYSREDAEIAAKKYFTTLKGENTRQMNGTKGKHLRQMCRTSRMDNKLKMRLSGLRSKHCKLSPSQKQNAKDILHMAYTSSDEDEVEKTDDGTEYRNVRILPWESNEARNLKASLLNTHIEHVLGERDRKRMQKLRRDENCAFSERKCPDNVPVWACNP